MKGRPHGKSRFKAALFVAAASPLLLAGCGRRIDFELPEKPTGFHTGTFVNPTDPDDTYLSIEYDGRTYIGYGIPKDKLDGNDVGRCLGYIIQDGAIMKDSRIFLLNADPDANYLLRFSTRGIMEQPDFFRALDTKGKTVNTPPYIERLNYSYWE